MAYTPINWQTGDTITAEKMNKMDNGWSVTMEVTTLFEETVTVESGGPFNAGSLNYSDIINQDTVTFTFNGTDYVCNRIDLFGEYFYGGFTAQGPDFTEYPFCIESISEGNFVYTQNAGTYTMKAVVVVKTVETSEKFCEVRGYWNTYEKTTLTEETVTTAQGSGDNAPVAPLSYETPIEASMLDVTINGTKYSDLPKTSFGAGSTYGATLNSDTFDFSTYSFSVLVTPVGNVLATQTAGQYTVKIEAPVTVPNMIEEFTDAVTKVANDSKDYGYVEQSYQEYNGTVTTTAQTQYSRGVLSGITSIDSNKITVSFLGMTYTVERNGGYYGARPVDNVFDFSVYPFSLENYNTDASYVVFYTSEPAGDYDLYIEGYRTVMQTNETFEDAVDSVTPSAVFSIPGSTKIYIGSFRNPAQITVPAHGSVWADFETYNTDTNAWGNCSDIVFAGATASVNTQNVAISGVLKMSSNNNVRAIVQNISSSDVTIQQFALTFRMIGFVQNNNQTLYYRQGER